MARIVFCEDEEQIRKLIEVAMRSTAHTIEMTTNGRDGLAAIERLMPELIVTDLAMPDMGGSRSPMRFTPSPRCSTSRSCSSLRRFRRADVARFSEHGAAGYLAKPFSPRALREKIDELIARAPEPAR